MRRLDGLRRLLGELYRDDAIVRASIDAAEHQGLGDVDALVAAVSNLSATRAALVNSYARTIAANPPPVMLPICGLCRASLGEEGDG